MTYREACDYLGQAPRPPLAGDQAAAKRAWEPRTCAAPGELWQRQARRLVDEAVYHLWAPPGRAVVDFLSREKGLNHDTIKAFSLGWLPADRWDAAPAWGLAEVLKDNGQPKKLWLPKGLTIPLCQGGQNLGTNVPKAVTNGNYSENQEKQENQEVMVERVRIRRPEGEPRYFLLRGSSTRALLIGERWPVAMVVESELDAMLLHQEAGDLVDLLSLGNAQARPDREAADLLQRSGLILVCLDADQAGAKEAWRWWPAHYPQAHRWPPIQGKDPGEMFGAGVDLAAWVQAGLAEYRNEVDRENRREDQIF